MIKISVKSYYSSAENENNKKIITWHFCGFLLLKKEIEVNLFTPEIKDRTLQFTS